MMAYEKHPMGAQYVASIVVDGKPLREYNEKGTRVCRIPFGSEYTIRIKNKSAVRALAAISIDGTEITAAGTRVVIPAYGTVNLERFVDLATEGKRFKFISVEQGAATGEIQDPTSHDNGFVRIQIYPEKERPQPTTTFTTQSIKGGYNSLRSRKISTAGYVSGAGGQSAGGIPPDSGSSWSLSSANGPLTTCNTVPTSAAFNGSLSDLMTLGRETVERSLPEAEKGATVEGSTSHQRFGVDNSTWDVHEIPVTFELQLRGPKQAPMPIKEGWRSVKDANWQGAVAFTVKVKDGRIWVEDHRGHSVITQFLAFEGDFIRMKTRDFEFANQFQRDCLNLSADGFEIRAYVKDRVVYE